MLLLSMVIACAPWGCSGTSSGSSSKGTASSGGVSGSTSGSAGAAGAGSTGTVVDAAVPGGGTLAATSAGGAGAGTSAASSKGGTASTSRREVDAGMAIDAAPKGGNPDAARAPDAAAGRSGGGQSGGTGGTSGGTSASGGRPKVVAASGATLVKVDVSSKRQTFEGWGTSLAWWAYQIGGWAAAKKNQFADLLVDPVNGLGYNVFRYNIGGGDAPSHDHMGENREMPGFQSASGTWDWNADARQTSVLSRLVASGKNVIIEAFSNSPPYWMTKSGCASGSSDGSNNLKDDSYGAFATYLVSVTKHYKESLGITFRTLEPLNEPNANWWKSNGSQEGCHFSASNQQQIIKAVAAELGTQGVTDTKVSASDENSMDDALTIMSAYDSATMAAIAQMNVHSYAGSKRTQLRSLATSKGKRLWQSESGPLSVDLASNTDAALFMAGRIIQDLRELQPEAWIEWQVVDPATNWTSFTVNNTQQSWTPVKRFYVQAGFSRFIRPGAVFVDINNADMVAALAGDGASLAVVARNGEASASKSFTFDLTSLLSPASTVEIYRSSAKEDLVHLESIAVKDWSFTATVPAYSVTTFVVPLAP